MSKLKEPKSELFKSIYDFCNWLTIKDENGNNKISLIYNFLLKVKDQNFRNFIKPKIIISLSIFLFFTLVLITIAYYSVNVKNLLNIQKNISPEQIGEIGSESKSIIDNDNIPIKAKSGYRIDPNIKAYKFYIIKLIENNKVLIFPQFKELLSSQFYTEDISNCKFFSIDDNYSFCNSNYSSDIIRDKTFDNCKLILNFINKHDQDYLAEVLYCIYPYKNNEAFLSMYIVKAGYGDKMSRKILEPISNILNINYR